MLSWWTAVILACALTLGCGGGQRGGLVKPEGTPPELAAQEVEPFEAAAEKEETLGGELSAKRMEELAAKSGLQGLDPSIEEELKKWDQKLKYDMPIDVNRQVKAYLVYFSTERKNIIRRYLARSTRYLPMIHEIFQEHGLPEDLAYLAMVESGFNPHAYSHASACGMWQFIRGTGLRYGLTINNYVDERRDPEKSTVAAAKYMTDLYKRFGSWYLAAASYNCGEGRVEKEINTSTHKNFWELSDNQCLPTETKNYVPQMIAAMIIAKNPEKFGFKGVPYLPPLKFDTVKVTEPTSLKAAAVASGVSLEEIQMLNPEIRKGVTPPDVGSYALKIPQNATDKFNRNIMMARGEFPALASEPVTAGVSGRSWRRSSAGGSSRKAAASARYRSKGKTVAAAKGKKPVQTAAVTKEKSGKAKAASSEVKVQTASILGGGKASKPAGNPAIKSTTNTAKKTNSGATPKKAKKKSNQAARSGPVRLAKTGG
jgi:membrane-bound lytic murein transglycosylase D